MKTVLLVEDDKSIAKAVQLRLVAQGFKVDIAYDAITAPMVARRCNPDIALLDVSMPGGDGFDVAERLQGIFGDIAIIFITANGRRDIRRRAEDMGAKGFFEKPFHSEELVAAVAAAA